MISWKQLIAIILLVMTVIGVGWTIGKNNKRIREEMAKTPTEEYVMPPTPLSSNVSMPVMAKQIHIIFPGGISTKATISNPSIEEALIDTVFIDGVILQTNKQMKVYDYTGEVDKLMSK